MCNTKCIAESKACQQFPTFLSFIVRPAARACGRLASRIITSGRPSSSKVQAVIGQKVRYAFATKAPPCAYALPLQTGPSCARTASTRFSTSRRSNNRKRRFPSKSFACFSASSTQALRRLDVSLFVFLISIILFILLIFLLL